MIHRMTILAAASLTAVLAGAVRAPHAFAGTYAVSAPTTAGVAHWAHDLDAGFVGCSAVMRPVPCPAAPPLTVYALGSAAAWGHGAWELVAPPTTSFVSGRVGVAYRTTSPDVDAYMKAHLRSESLATSPTLDDTTGDGSASWNIPSGNEVVRVTLRTAAAHTFATASNNWLRVDSVSATLRDDTPPSLSVAGPLADGSWHSEHQPVCADVAAHDAGGGVAAVTLGGGSGDLAAATAPAESWLQPGAVDEAARLCTAPAGLTDGVHALVVTARDAAGETATRSFDLRVDATAPTLSASAPVGDVTDRRPTVTLTVDPGPSGIAELTAEMDGAPLAVDGATATLMPASDLAFGGHVISYHAVDVAGNSRDGSYAFRVADPTPPQLAAATPAAGSELEQPRPEIGFTLTDEGVGIDPATLRVALDGVEIGAAGDLVDGLFDYLPGSDLSYGPHRLRVAVSDLSGNAMTPVEWLFSVVDRTPPSIADVRPDPGSAGADRTPAVSAAVIDGGTGIDPASVRVEIDGTQVAGAVVAGTRVGYQPQTPLPFGTHTVTVRASDRAGNAAAPVTWTFEVRDEDAPTLSAGQPAAGSTVIGAAAIAFDLSDGGVGVDPSTLRVTLDGVDVTAWGVLDGNSFRYAPGTLGAGAHTVAVTVADRSGNVAGPVMWQFATADPATLAIAVRSAPSAVLAGSRPLLRFQVTSAGRGLAGARLVLTSRPYGAAGYGYARTLTADASGAVAVAVHPLTGTSYRLVLSSDPAVAVVRSVAVRRSVGVSAGATSVRRGGVVRLAGLVTPAAAGQRIAIQALTRAGWVTVARPHLGRLHRYVQYVSARVPGWYTLRAVAPAVPGNLGGVSRTIRLRVV